MKKIFVALFLAAALVAPALADGLELIPKLGYLFSPEITVDGYSGSEDSGIQIGAEVFFDMQNNFFLGAGLIWGQNTKYDKNVDEKMIDHIIRANNGYLDGISQKYLFTIFIASSKFL